MNPALATIEPSLIRSISARKRPDDIDLGLGEPTLRPAMEPFEAATRWVRENGCPYTPNAGFPELRERIAGYLGAGISPTAGVCVTVGSEEAIYLAIKAAVNPATDEVLIVEPCYLAYPKICLMEGVRHRMVALSPEDGFRPSAARVLEAVREDTRLLIINTPSNPTGRVWPREELEALARGLSKRPGEPVMVLSDEVYRELIYLPERPPSIGELYPHSLIAGSLSKSSALTGLRLGWLAGPAPVIEAATKVHQFVNTAASTFSQRVALEHFREPGALGASLPAYIDARTALLAESEAAGLELIEPEGAFYALVRLAPRLRDDSLAAALELLERERVVAVPGRAFGPSGEGWLRISWVAERERLLEGVRRIGRFNREGAGASR
jgi:aspartate/methionine/tyrosine aminotransferase